MAKNAATAQVHADGHGTTAERSLKDAIHLSLQGKGGVGKSLVASILAQYFNSRGKRIQCIDTDPVTRIPRWLQLACYLLRICDAGRCEFHGDAIHRREIPIPAGPRHAAPSHQSRRHLRCGLVRMERRRLTA